MKQQIQLLDKTLLLKMSPSAERLLSYRHQPLLVEMELYSGPVNTMQMPSVVPQTRPDKAHRA
jgi:hypothetical protein